MIKEVLITVAICWLAVVPASAVAAGDMGDQSHCCDNPVLDGAEMSFVGCEPNAAYKRLNELSKLGDAKALYILGRIQELGGESFGLPAVPVNLDLAQRYYLASAQRGYVEAEARVGWIDRRYYRDSENLKGLYWLCKAASHGSAEAKAGLDVYVQSNHINQSASDFCAPIITQESLRN